MPGEPGRAETSRQAPAGRLGSALAGSASEVILQPCAGPTGLGVLPCCADVGSLGASRPWRGVGVPSAAVLRHQLYLGHSPCTWRGASLLGPCCPCQVDAESWSQAPLGRSGGEAEFQAPPC